MTITSFSERVTYFSEVSTKSSAEPTVGPGSYGTLSSNGVNPSHVGFSSTVKRLLSDKRNTPGPGSYSTENRLYEAQKEHNSFQTKVSRFAPTAPGSSIYKSSTISENPGPGAYSDGEPFLKQSKRNIVKRNEAHTKCIDYSQKTVPTIPRKEQSYGYIQEPNGSYKIQKGPNNVYTGLGGDTVGPAYYQNNIEFAETSSNRACFGKSNTKRELWNLDHSPGPGQYPAKSEERSNKSRPNAVFSSKVPILPLYPEKEDSSTQQTITEVDVNRYKSPRHAKSGNFGTNSDRNKLTSTLDAPFSSPSYLASPGPGSYMKQSSRFERPIRTSKSLREEKIAFQATSQRECLSKTKTNSNLGPGSYNSDRVENNHNRGKCPKKSIGRKGVFGTTSKRFNHTDWNIPPETLDTEDLTPGPGAYETNSGSRVHVRTSKAHASVAFSSKSNRFSQSKLNQMNNQPTENLGTPGIVIEEERSRLSLNGSPRNTVKKPFMSQAKRSIENSVFGVNSDNPGPGSYISSSNQSQENVTRSNLPRCTIGSSIRFKSENKKDVGPGSYTFGDTIGTKSFNVRLKAPQQ